MRNTELLEHLKCLSNPERLALIETASRLIREDLTTQDERVRKDQDRRLEAAALQVKDLYEPGGELTGWVSLEHDFRGAGHEYG